MVLMFWIWRILFAVRLLLPFCMGTRIFKHERTPEADTQICFFDNNGIPISRIILINHTIFIKWRVLTAPNGTHSSDIRIIFSWTEIFFRLLWSQAKLIVLVWFLCSSFLEFHNWNFILAIKDWDRFVWHFRSLLNTIQWWINAI